jgi:hypothetical protein
MTDIPSGHPESGSPRPEKAAEVADLAERLGPYSDDVVSELLDLARAASASAGQEDIERSADNADQEFDGEIDEILEGEQ